MPNTTNRRWSESGTYVKFTGRGRGAVCLTYVKAPAHHHRSLLKGHKKPASSWAARCVPTTGDFRDGNKELYRNAVWGRHSRSAGCHEARRNDRGYACALIVGIATGRAGLDHLCRGAHVV